MIERDGHHFAPAVSSSLISLTDGTLSSNLRLAVDRERRGEDDPPAHDCGDFVDLDDLRSYAGLPDRFRNVLLEQVALGAPRSKDFNLHLFPP